MLFRSVMKETEQETSVGEELKTAFIKLNFSKYGESDSTAQKTITQIRLAGLLMRDNIADLKQGGGKSEAFRLAMAQSLVDGKDNFDTEGIMFHSFDNKLVERDMKDFVLFANNPLIYEALEKSGAVKAGRPVLAGAMAGEDGREKGMIFSPLFNEEGKITGVGEKTASRKEIYATVPVIGLTFNEAINDFETDRIEAKEGAESLQGQKNWRHFIDEVHVIVDNALERFLRVSGEKTEKDMKMFEIQKLAAIFASVIDPSDMEKPRSSEDKQAVLKSKMRPEAYSLSSVKEKDRDKKTAAYDLLKKTFPVLADYNDAQAVEKMKAFEAAGKIMPGITKQRWRSYLEQALAARYRYKYGVDDQIVENQLEIGRASCRERV